MDKGYYTRTEKSSVLTTAVAIHNKNGQGLLHSMCGAVANRTNGVAIHNKNGQGLLREDATVTFRGYYVAIHNKNGQGLLP